MKVGKSSDRMKSEPPPTKPQNPAEVLQRRVQPLSFTSRWIGALAIVDVHGDVSVDTASGLEERFRILLGRLGARHLLLNFRPARYVEVEGLRHLLAAVISDTDTGLLAHAADAPAFSPWLKTHPRFFRDELEVVDHFSSHMVEQVPGLFREQRRSPRLKVALAAEVDLTDAYGSRIRFRGVVTDMSEGGLLLERLDVMDADQADVWIDPYALRPLRLRMVTGEGGYLLIDVDLVRTIVRGNQVGLGFAFRELGDVEVEKIRRFLKNTEERGR